MAKVQSLGIFHTAMGRFLVFPCGCEKENLDANRQKASLMILNGGSYSKPVWHTFETDYIFEDRPQLVEIED